MFVFFLVFERTIPDDAVTALINFYGAFSVFRLKDGYQWAVSGGAGARAGASASALGKDAPIRKPNVRARRAF